MRTWLRSCEVFGALLALPTIVWLTVFFIVAGYVLLAIAFGEPELFTRSCRQLAATIRDVAHAPPPPVIMHKIRPGDRTSPVIMHEIAW